MRTPISGTSAKPSGRGLDGVVANANAINGRISKKVMCSLMGIPITLPIFSDEAMMFEYYSTKYISL